MPEKSTMARAHQAPRCTHTKSDGHRCQSPALKGKSLCYFHSRIRYPRRSHMLRRLDDGNSVQVTILQAVRALREGTIDPQSARLLLWGLQLASANLKNVTHEALQHPVLPRDVPEPKDLKGE
ncbi:MAG: zf-C3Hc3H domain-containing protein [Acidobacteria bacterium]|nr:zf-C3Hc3H domain-containing protein [Acidobacteriota bacterium]